MSECTTEKCSSSVPDNIFLCPFCIRDLQAYIDKAHLYAPELNVTIAKLDVLRHAGSTGGGGGKAGSAAPINLDAVQLQTNLCSVDKDAKVYALDQFAAGIAWIIQDWVAKAELLISGPEEERVDHAAVKARVIEAAPPMPTRQLVKWLRTEVKISVKPKDIRNWAMRGKLRAVEREPLPTYWPHEIIELHTGRIKA